VRLKTDKISKVIEESTISTFVSKALNYNVLNKKAGYGGTVFAGDSIAELYPINEFFAEWQEKTKRPLYNRGISGELSGNLLSRFEENILSIKPENLIFIIGTNDLAQGTNLESIRDNIEKMITWSKRSIKDINIILLGILPVNENMKDIPSRLMVGIRKNSVIKELNDILKRLTEETNVIFADISQVLVSEDGQLSLDYTFDGLHPNTKGYEIITEAILPFLQ
jgi:alpha-L-fucosidase